jgi:hypothetical protein
MPGITAIYGSRGKPPLWAPGPVHFRAPSTYLRPLPPQPPISFSVLADDFQSELKKLVLDGFFLRTSLITVANMCNRLANSVGLQKWSVSDWFSCIECLVYSLLVLVYILLI